MIKMFASIGVLTVIFVAVLALIIATESLEERVKESKRQHTIKHRFDKPPTAKCYCRDCKFWIPENGECHVSHTAKGYCMADNWFCYSAEPVTGEIGKQREEWIRKNTEERRKKR